MNRQQAPQPVVRPVQIGDSVTLLEDTDVIADNEWYLAIGIVVGLPQGVLNAAAVRRVSDVMQIAVKSSNVDFWYCTGSFDADTFKVNSISKGSESIVLDMDTINDYRRYMHCQSYDYIVAEPVNVSAGFEV